MSNINLWKNQFMKNSNLQGIVIFAISLLVFSSAAHAAMPWENALANITCDVSSGTVKWLAVLAIVLGGVMYGLGELSGPFQKALQIAAGFSIAVGATTFANSFLGLAKVSCSGI